MSPEEHEGGISRAMYIEECVSGMEADISAAQYSTCMQVHSGC